MEQLGVNIEDIKKLTSALASNSGSVKSVKREPKQVTIIEPPKIVQCNDPNSPGAGENTQSSSEIIDQTGGTDVNTSLFGGNSQFVSLNGYALPRYTMYLIIVLILLGIGIWYLNSDQRKSKKKIIDNNDEKE